MLSLDFKLYATLPQVMCTILIPVLKISVSDKEDGLLKTMTDGMSIGHSGTYATCDAYMSYWSACFELWFHC